MWDTTTGHSMKGIYNLIKQYINIRLHIALAPNLTVQDTIRDINLRQQFISTIVVENKVSFVPSKAQVLWLLNGLCAVGSQITFNNNNQRSMVRHVIRACYNICTYNIVPNITSGTKMVNKLDWHTISCKKVTKGWPCCNSILSSHGIIVSEENILMYIRLYIT